METPKKILVVDDDEIMRDGICSLLRAEGHEVTWAENGFEAKRLIETKTFELVVSDVQMPIMDGLQLLQIVKRDTQCKFLMMTEPSSALQTRHGLMLGADEFLNKPFSKTDFLRAIATALSSHEPSKVIGQEYVPLPIDEFVTGTTLKVDLFLKLISGRFVKIGNKGGTLSQERIQGYLDKGLYSVYMKKQDFANYVSFNINIAQVAHADSNIECNRKLRLTKHVTETLITQLCDSGLKREQLENASSVVMNTVELILENPATMKLLEGMDTIGTLPSHSIAVSIWACLIGKRLGWKGQQTYFKIALCSLFHDVGQKEMDEALLAKPRFELTQAELKVVQSHAFRGRDILQSVPLMPEDVSIVAFQHHELYHGGGYPHGIKLEQIHPMARLISVANAFTDALSEVPGSGPKRLETALDSLVRNKRDYDPAFLKMLVEIVGDARQASAAA